MYKCFKTDFEALEKRIKTITKKLDKQKLKWKFEVISETIEEVKVISYINSENIPAWQFTPKFMGTQIVEVINYNFEMETLKLGNYEVIAVIDHNTILNSTENIIHIINNNITIDLKYRNIKSNCQHCNSDRKRNKTILLIDNNNNQDIIQVGSTCLKEFIGIDCLNIIGNYQDINDICLTELNIDFEYCKKYPKLNKTVDYVASCIQTIKEVGYQKTEQNNPTKYVAWELLENSKLNNEFIPLAITIIEYFKNKEFPISDNFYQNIKNYLSQDYTNINGFIAYSSIAYNKLIEIDSKKQAEAIQDVNKKESSFIGAIGEKIETELTFKNVYSFESEWGITKIYLFEDSKGNVYKWNSTNSIDKKEGEQLKLKGTIKKHEEYKEQKQTVLTRCKVVI
jgi:hypothetical protein